MKNLKPGKEFGEWIESKRKSRGFITRDFANLIGLRHAKLAEVEVGICKWMTTELEIKIKIVLELTKSEIAEFDELLYQAMMAGEINFSDVFTREQLYPMLIYQNERLIRPTPELCEKILDVVFTPLE